MLALQIPIIQFDDRNGVGLQCILVVSLEYLPNEILLYILYNNKFWTLIRWSNRECCKHKDSKRTKRRLCIEWALGSCWYCFPYCTLRYNRFFVSGGGSFDRSVCPSDRGQNKSQEAVTTDTSEMLSDWKHLRDTGYYWELHDPIGKCSTLLGDAGC